MQKSFIAVIASCLIFVQQLVATDLKPWSAPIYTTEFRGSLLLQQFDKLDTKCGTVKRRELDAFYNFGLLGVCEENVAAEMELLVSNTRYRSFGLNALRITGRYFFFSDTVGDPVALSAGLTFSKIFDASRRNVAIFDHGGIACEAHVAVGKEISCEDFWTSRAWGVLGLGIADVGYPWLRANLVWERNWWEIHQFKVFADTIWGFGPHHLKVCPHFHGYGSVNYQAIDVGVRYARRFCNNALLSFAYAYRVYGRNCPINVNLFLLEYCYPFSL